MTDVVVPSLLAKSVVEFTGCLLFHFLGSVCPTPEANAVVLMTMVYYSAKVSGAHLNPIISSTFTMLGYTPPTHMVVYWLAQISGSVSGALLVAALVPGCAYSLASRMQPADICSYFSGCFKPMSSLTHAQVFCWEMLTTLAFIVPVFSVVWYTQNKSGYGTTGPIMVGLSLLSAAYGAAPFTGASLNPARLLGSAIVFNCGTAWTTLALMIAGQVCASLVSVACIVPWYGIAEDAWFVRRVPQKLLSRIEKCSSKCITLTTMHPTVQGPASDE